MKVQYRNFAPADLLTVTQHMPYSLTQSTTGIVAYNPETFETLAVFLAENWTRNSAQVHQVIIRPMVIRHRWFEEIADYMFTRAKLKKLYATVPEGLTRALTVNEKLGFEELLRLEQAIDDNTDYILMELKRDNCPYWENNHG